MTDRVLLDFDPPSASLFQKPLLFDTNVWILVQGPQIDLTSRRSRIYSGFYAAAVKLGAKIILPQIVAVEFVNVCLYLAASLDGWSKSDGKIHRQAQYASWIKSALDDLNAIASDCVRVGDSFDAIDLEALISRAEESSCDFNDSIISAVCETHGALLVTDDADMFAQELPIASANKRVLD